MSSNLRSEFDSESIFAKTMPDADHFLQHEARLHKTVEDLKAAIIEWGQRWLMWPGEMSFGMYHDHFGEPPRNKQAYVLLVSINPEILYGLTIGEKTREQPYVELRALMKKRRFTYDLEDGYLVTIYPDNEEEQEICTAILRWSWVKHLLAERLHDIHAEVYEHFRKHPELLVEIGWRDYEVLLDSVFRNQGFRTELGPGTNDGGVDIRLYQSTTHGELVTLVQAKRYRRAPVKLDAVAAMRGLVDAYGAHSGLVVATSRFLPSAQKFAAIAPRKVQLATSADVARWCADISDALDSFLSTGQSSSLKFESNAGNAAMIGRIVHATYNYNDGSHRNQFRRVVADYAREAVLQWLPTDKAGITGVEVPIETHLSGSCIIAQKSTYDGGVSYWGDGKLFTIWDGKPAWYNHND